MPNMLADGRRVTLPWWPVVLVVAILSVSNVLTNRILPGWAYAPWGVVLALVLVGVARLDGCTATDLGLHRRRLLSGLRWGGLAAGCIVVLYVVALVLPPTRELFDDARVRDTGAWGAAYQVGVRIPLGTVLAEEVAFRGVLLALLVPRVGVARAVAGSSALFGLWHLLPALGIGDANPVSEELFAGPGGTLAAATVAVLGTAVAGVVFCWLRLRSGSLAAPALLHLATNGLGFTLAWLYLRWS